MRSRVPSVNDDRRLAAFAYLADHDRLRHACKILADAPGRHADEQPATRLRIDEEGAVAVARQHVRVADDVGGALKARLAQQLAQPVERAPFNDDRVAPRRRLHPDGLAGWRRGALLGGGVAGGTVLQSLIPMLAGAGGGLDVGALLGQAVGGGVAGAILTFIVGLIKNMMAGQPAR